MIKSIISYNPVCPSEVFKAIFNKTTVVKEKEPVNMIEAIKPKVGDFVKFTEETIDYDVTAGKYYKIKSVNEDGVWIIDDVGEEFCLYAQNYEVYEKKGGEWA